MGKLLLLCALALTGCGVSAKDALEAKCLERGGEYNDFRPIRTETGTYVCYRRVPVPLDGEATP